MATQPGFTVAETADRTANGLFLGRLLKPRTALLFARNTVASFLAFAVDMLILWMLVQFGGLAPLPAATIAFLIAISIHYVLCRIWVFCGTERGIGAGYFYFLINAGVGLAVTLALFAALVELAGLHYLIARIIASVFAGIGVFLLNAMLNFRSV